MRVGGCVWVGGCVGVWVSGRVGVWVCGCVGVCVCGCVCVSKNNPTHPPHFKKATRECSLLGESACSVAAIAW